MRDGLGLHVLRFPSRSYRLFELTNGICHRYLDHSTLQYKPLSTLSSLRRRISSQSHGRCHARLQTRNYLATMLVIRDNYLQLSTASFKCSHQLCVFSSFVRTCRRNEVSNGEVQVTANDSSAWVRMPCRPPRTSWYLLSATVSSR